MDLLLDVDVLLELCLAPRQEDTRSAPALARCTSDGGRVWLYAGSAQTYLIRLAHALREAQAEEQRPTPESDGAAGALALLRAFALGKHWLAALPGDLGDLDEPDLVVAQHLRALDRIETGTVRLLTLDPSLVRSHPDKAIDPEGYCALAPARPRIDFIDLKAQQDRIRAPLETAIHRVLHHGRFILGPEVTELEKRLAGYTGVDHCVTVSSGTDALLIALMALGIGPGDEVVTTPFTFVATAEVIVLAGATPVFVDIEPDTYNIDASRIEAAITPRTKAIMPVSLYGQPADMDEINAIAARYNLPVIEDAAQSFGATYKGRKSCNLSTVGCTSFFPSKPLGCYGDGGAIFTNDGALAKATREIRVHGQAERYIHSRIGVCGRMDTLQCAVLLAKLEHFDGEIARRAEAGQRYTEMLTGRPEILPPTIRSDRTSVYAQYTIQTGNREAIAASLSARDIPIAVHYPVPLDAQPAYERFRGTEHAPVAARLAARVLSLPMHADLPQDTMARVVSAVEAALAT